MRLHALVALVSLLAVSPALAQSQTEEDVKKGLKGTGKYGTAGCGLGSMAFGDQPGGIQILAATTNGILGNQTFGITFGTLQLRPQHARPRHARLRRGEPRGAREGRRARRGRGDRRPHGDQPLLRDSHAVGAALQARFGAIFPSEQATDEQVTGAILETLHVRPGARLREGLARRGAGGRASTGGARAVTPGRARSPRAGRGANAPPPRLTSTRARRAPSNASSRPPRPR